MSLPSDVHHISSSEIWAAQILNGSSLAALILVVYDLFLTADDELKYIWSNRLPRTSSFMKWAFIFIRYFGLGILIVHRFIGPSHMDSVPATETCRQLYIFEIVTAQIMMGSVEALLMFRVWALYNKNRAMGIVFFVCLILEPLAIFAIVLYTVPHSDFGPLCVVTMKPRTITYFCLVGSASQSVIWNFTAYKCYQAVCAGWGNKPIMKLLIRDGSYTIFALFAPMVVNIILYATVSESLTMISTYWLVALMSIAGCRMIINMQDLSRDSENFSDLSTLMELSIPVFTVDEAAEAPSPPQDDGAQP